MRNNRKEHRAGKPDEIKDKAKALLIKDLGGMRQRIIQMRAGSRQREGGLNVLVTALSSLINELVRPREESLDLDTVVSNVLDSFLGATGLSAGVLYLARGASGKLSPAVSRGISGEFAEALKGATFDDGEAGGSAGAIQVVTIPDTCHDRRVDGSARTYFEAEKIRFFIRVPLRSRDRTVGVIDAGAGKPGVFKAEDASMLEVLGCLMGIAIEHTQLIEKMGRTSDTDEVTGLFNRQRFDEVLEMEVYRSQRYGSTFSLATLEFDGLDRYVKEFGRTSGDVILKAFAQKLKTELRMIDVACRSGEGKFLLIMAETKPQKAMKAIERIRQEFTQMPEVSIMFREFGLGLSAGIAGFPQVAETAEGIMIMAECALCYARMQGRNRSVLMSDSVTRTNIDRDMERLEEVRDISEYTETLYPGAQGRKDEAAIVSELLDKVMGLRRN